MWPRLIIASYVVGYYQPETAYQIFTRTILGKDVATGTVPIDQDPGYSSEGPADVFDVKNEVLPQVDSQCYVLVVPLSPYCTDDQIAALVDGTAVVEDYVVVNPPGRVFS